MFLAALPLLAASLSRDPLQVSLVTFAGWLPWLLFGLISGALVDRWDRRRVMWRVDACRVVVVGVLGVAVLAGWATIPLLAAVGFLLGTGQTLFDNVARRSSQRWSPAPATAWSARTASSMVLGPWARTSSAHLPAACCSRWAPPSRSWSMPSRLRPAPR
jgi:MFS family permease